MGVSGSPDDALAEVGSFITTAKAGVIRCRSRWWDENGASLSRGRVVFTAILYIKINGQHMISFTLALRPYVPFTVLSVLPAGSWAFITQ